MCEEAEAVALQPRRQPAPVQLPALQMRLAETLWPLMAASSDSQAPALGASSGLIAVMAASSALVVARPAAASDWLVLQPISSDRQPP